MEVNGMLAVISRLSISVSTNVPGKPSNESTPKYRPGVLVYQMTEENMKIFSDISSKEEYNYIPSLSCYKKPIQSCDQDTGTLLLSEEDIQCLAIQNPTGKTVFFNISLSFKVSVFGENTFTSPDVPGGNDVTSNSTNSSSGASSSYNNNNYLIMNNSNRFGVVIITLMVIGLGKMITL
ncbi:5936_t:CDS:2 [Diversispora eburnea]|uniref:5936_t:CDS:1 n=1 Tax=Diversispora eburnea TaxID=1213867 RepID=A0A9N8WBY9_9GLOM|nr:5936_t:CDS:2 [Diversispora eburnea]